MRKYISQYILKSVVLLILILFSPKAFCQKDVDIESILLMNSKLHNTQERIFYDGSESMAAFFFKDSSSRSIYKRKEDSVTGNTIFEDSILLNIEEYNYILGKLRNLDSTNWLSNYYSNCKLIPKKVLDSVFSESLVDGWSFIHNHYGLCISTFIKPIFYQG